MVMKTSVIIKELEGIASAQHDSTYIDFRASGNHCFIIDHSFKFIKAGAKYKVTIELIQEDTCHISMES